MSMHDKLLALTLSLAVMACDLEVEDPDVVTPGALTTREALPTIRAAALGDFILSYSGSGAEGSAGGTEGIIQMSGMLGDELINTETFPTRIEVDRRNIQVTNGTVGNWFRTLSSARRATEFAAARYEEFVPAAELVAETGYPEMIALSGYSYLFFAENFCSGVPFSTANPDGTFTYGMPLNAAQMYDSAVAKFTRAQAAALALTAATGTRRQLIMLATVGLARAQLDQGNPGAAAATLAAITPPLPTDTAYVVTHSENTTRQYNGVFNAVNINERYGVADGEGNYAADACTSTTNCVGTGPGLLYRSDADPRISFIRTGGNDVGFDSRTPQFDQRRYLDRRASVPLASGLEARLIEAEAAYAAGANASHLPILNALRAAPPAYILANGAPIAPLTPDLTDPGTPEGRVDQLFKERAYWLWLTGHRLGDMRRLMRHYLRTEAQVFPTGAYFKGGQTYGTDKNFPVPQDEQNNPNFEQCLNRDP